MPGTSSVVGVQDVLNGPVRTITVATASYSSSPVLKSAVFPATVSTPVTGYLAYDSFATPIGEVQLADTFRNFAAAGVTSLVVDLRYNGGGYLDIASQLGYMVAGPAQTTGRAFEKLVHNDKRSTENSAHRLQKRDHRFIRQQCACRRAPERIESEHHLCAHHRQHLLGQRIVSSTPCAASVCRWC